MKASLTLVNLIAITVCLSFPLTSAAFDNAACPYGVCAHLPGEGDVRTELGVMKAAGIGWVRADFSWSGVEPQRGSWTFTRFDNVVRIADSMQVGILPILNYDAAWGDTAWRHLDLWIAYVDTMVRRYKGSLRYWEVWNEENISFWKDGTQQREEHYFQLLKATYQAIKAVDPQLVVLLGGLAGVPFDYIDSIYAKGGRAYFDIMNMHPYRYPTPPEVVQEYSGYSFYSQMAALRAKMRLYGDSAKPLWITEVGWPTHWVNTSFWASIIRSGLRRANGSRTNWKGAYLEDAEYPPSQSVSLPDDALRSALPGAGSTMAKVTLGQLSTLGASGFQALIMPPGESFPVDYYDAIKAFVKGGGAVVFSGGVPLYYALKKSVQGTWTSSGASGTYRQQLHFDFEAWWTNPNAPQTTTDLVVQAAFRDSIIVPAGTEGTRFVSAGYIKSGDTLVPMINGRATGYEAPVAATIKLGSDSLKGAGVIATLNFSTNAVTPERQAAMLPRLYLAAFQTGIARTFWYEFQATETDSFYNEDHFGITHRDFSPKPAYTAYKALTRARPAGSQTIGSESWCSADSSFYYPHWQRPDGKRGWALWILKNPQTYSITFTGSIDSVFDNAGAPVSYSQQGSTVLLQLSEYPVYVIGPQTLSFAPAAVRVPGAMSCDMPKAVFAMTGRAALRVRVEDLKMRACEIAIYSLSGKKLFSRSFDHRRTAVFTIDRVAFGTVIVQVKSNGICLHRKIALF